MDLTEIEFVNLYTENYCIEKAEKFIFSEQKGKTRKLFPIRALNYHFLLQFKGPVWH